MNELPETILQFGGGNFLRGFVDLFVEQANRAGQRVGRIVIVQSTDSGVAERLNAQQGKYHVVVRGLRDGRRVDEVEEVNSISRAIDSRTGWREVLEMARSPHLRMIVSNTTEAGFALDVRDEQRRANRAPFAFPAKLLDVLWQRFDAGIRKRVCIAPCELIAKNGDRLKSLVLDQATRWDAPNDLIEFLTIDCCWINSLVDRIVSGKPAEHPLLASDGLLTVTEPFALWAIEDQLGNTLPSHPAIQLVEDTAPFELRKIRILNGAHTALVARALPIGIQTVREAVNHPEVGPWLRRLLDEEIAPTIEDRVPDARGFIVSTLERFANPFLEHKLSAIALHHEKKLQTRLMPTRDEYLEKFGKSPPLLDEIINKHS